jgi:Fungal N-terminal domain of STAND proteins
MDPLSISASVAGLITLAELVLGRGFKLAKAFRNADQEVTKLIAEVTSLYGVLQSLRLVALRFEGEVVDSTQS